MASSYAERILQSRRGLMEQLSPAKRAQQAAEGGCGVLGFAANIPVAGRHVLKASRQMHNRGNGKGGGIAMVGLDPQQARVDRDTLQSHYLLQVALLDPAARQEVENSFILPYFDVAQHYGLDHLEDYSCLPDLEVRPPDVWRYFVRVKPAVLEEFATRNGFTGDTTFSLREIEDEFVYQNTFKLNRRFYASLGEQRAFVLSHGRNLSVLKIVGYAEDVVQYYCLEDQTAQVWIAHQRYPTKGRVWHPGGAHPFIGLNEALVHNGDFANYHAVGEYLRQRNIGQLFLTDTEVSVQLFDLWDRVYRYPLEVTLEAMAPTSEHDFAMLPVDKQELYQAVQRTHMHGSPDGPWFFIVARSLGQERVGAQAESRQFELLGITDTSMLRPQVFALYENSTPQGLGGVQIGLIASERQAINACLRSLSEEDARFQPLADRYWVARGGSHTDGGAFRFSVAPDASAEKPGKLTCANKFGQPVRVSGGRHIDVRSLDPEQAPAEFRSDWQSQALHAFDDGGASTFQRWLALKMPEAGWNELAWGLNWLGKFACQGDPEWDFVVENLTLLRDRRFDLGDKPRASLLRLVDENLECIFGLVKPFETGDRTSAGAGCLNKARRMSWKTRDRLRPPQGEEHLLVLDSAGFPAEGEQSAARWMVQASQRGWKRQIAYNWRGGRFAACGFGPDSSEVRIDLYGDVGDYMGSGLDGAEVHLHADGQDQVGQILKSGKLVIYGDAGQTFLYGAKGGQIYVLGSVAGRPLINAVGCPIVVINGTCLDYLAESFMAGDPLAGGGFAVLNGVSLDERGHLQELESPYPGGNLFSLASGGAIYLRDPRRLVGEQQLNGGVFADLSPQDWDLIEPYLRENERLFGIRVQDLLMVDGQPRSPDLVYRKVTVHQSALLHETHNR
jgi:glutamate synthase domain-containing protein 1/glutamate synthase domain-containing protein 3